MIRFIFTLFAVAISSLPALAEDNPVVHKNELPGLIKQYLMDNPNVIIDAVQQAEKKAQEAESQESEAAVARFKDQIIDANAPTIGKPDAKVTIVEFYDYNCSACTLGQILGPHNPCSCNPGTSPVLGSFCG